MKLQELLKLDEDDSKKSLIQALGQLVQKANEKYGLKLKAGRFVDAFVDDIFTVGITLPPATFDLSSMVDDENPAAHEVAARLAKVKQKTEMGKASRAFTDILNQLDGVDGWKVHGYFVGVDYPSQGQIAKFDGKTVDLNVRSEVDHNEGDFQIFFTKD